MLYGRRLDQSLQHVDGSRYALVHAVAKRARQITLWLTADPAELRAEAAPPPAPGELTSRDPVALAEAEILDGEVKQDGRTSRMIFDLPRLVSWVSQAMTLEPGDLLLTGTPEGVGPLAPGQLLEVEIEGHADSLGASAFNRHLSRARAEAVRRFLIENGVAGERLVAVGYAESKPAAPNRTAAGRQLNRRGEFHIVEVNGASITSG